MSINPKGTPHAAMDNNRIEAPATVPLAITAKVATPGPIAPAGSKVWKETVHRRVEEIERRLVEEEIGRRRAVGAGIVAEVAEVRDRSRRHAKAAHATNTWLPRNRVQFRLDAG